MHGSDIKRTRVAVLLWSAVLLAACGGGGGYGGGDAPRPPPPPAPGILQFDPASFSSNVDENVGTVTLTITRTAGSDGAGSVRVLTGEATAIAGQDFTPLLTTVSFAAGDTAPKTVTVSIIDDSEAEGDEGFIVAMVEPTGGLELGPLRVAALRIRDNDPAPATPTAQVSAALKQLIFTWARVPVRNK